MIKIRKMHCHVGVMIGATSHLALSAEKMKLDMTMGQDGVFVVPKDEKLSPVFVPYGSIADCHLERDSLEAFLKAKAVVKK